MNNLTETQTEPVKLLGLYCTKVVLDPDISKALNEEAIKNMKSQVPDRIWSSLEENLSKQDMTAGHVVNYVKEYLSSNNDPRFFFFKEDATSVHWEESQGVWYIQVYHWEFPTPIFDAEFQKLIKRVRQGKGKIPIPEPDENSFPSLEDLKIEIVNDILHRSSATASAAEESATVEEGDKVLIRIDEQNGNPYELEFFMDSSYSGNHQIYDAILGSSKNQKIRLGIVTQDYEPKILEIEILEIKSIIDEIEEWGDVTEEITSSLGFKDENSFNEYVEKIAKNSIDEHRLMTLIDGIDIIFDHFANLPEIPMQITMDMLEHYPNLVDEKGVRNYFINRGFAEVFLDFKERDPSIVDMFVKSWALKRITFKDTKDPNLWNLIE